MGQHEREKEMGKSRRRQSSSAIAKPFVYIGSREMVQELERRDVEANTDHILKTSRARSTSD